MRTTPRPPFVTNASDAAQQDRVDLVLTRREKQWRDALKDVLETHAGRYVMWHVLERAGLHACVVRSMVSDRELFAREGRRELGLELLEDVEACGDRYYEMQREERARQQAEDRVIQGGRRERPAEELVGDA